MRSSEGLVAQLRHPPGGRNARIMLTSQFLDRMGTGVWGASSVLYFTFVTRLDARQIGLLLGVAGVAGIAGSPLAGRLAGRFTVRSLLVGCHLLRLVTLCLVLMAGGFGTLLPVVAATVVGDRAAKTLEMLFATEAAGDRRATLRALSRSAANAGYALGAGVAAAGLAVGTPAAYRALVLGDALSFLAAAALVWRTREERRRPAAPPREATRRPAAPSPWRDGGYLLFVLLDVVMNLDGSVLEVGMPLWLVTRTSAPHALVPSFLLIDTALVVLLQMRVSARAEGPVQATRAVTVYGLTMLACCAVLATVSGAGTWAASAAFLLATVLVTMAELMRSVSSWELAVCLAPSRGRASYMGVAGMSQSVQKSAGPLLMTGAVMAAGPAGWLALGAGIAGLSVFQRRACSRRLARMARRPAHIGEASSADA